MSRNLVSVVGIASSLVVGVLIAFDGSQGSMVVTGLPLFLLCGLLAFAVQWVFFIPAWLFPENIFMNVVLMRLVIIAADWGSIHIGRKILRELRMPEKNILLYALNPFIIIELTGNEQLPRPRPNGAKLSTLLIEKRLVRCFF